MPPLYNVGNLLTLTRNSIQDLSTGTYKQIDALDYTYVNNELANVEDSSGDELGFSVSTASAAPITYDGNGNMLTFPSKGIQLMSYNINNLPNSITANGEVIEFDISLSGTQLKKSVGQGSTKDYLGGIEFVDGIATFYGHEEGRIVFDPSGDKYQYKISNHLGNKMVLFEDQNEDGIIENEVSDNPYQGSEILQRNHYYAFGLAYDGLSTDNLQPAQNYKYNGKELHDEGGIGLYNYGARFYDPAIARFTTVDRFTEKFSHQSGYVYAGNNPISFIDMNGDSIAYADQNIQDYVAKYTSVERRDKNGNIKYKRDGVTAKRNRNYDSEFASVINTLENSDKVFHFSSNGSSLDQNTLGLVSSRGDGKNFDVIVPDHTKTSKGQDQAIAGGRGAILAEETYHAFQVSSGIISSPAGSKGFVGGTVAAEVDAKIWSASRDMVNTTTSYGGKDINTSMGLIRSYKGDRMRTMKLLTEGTSVNGTNYPATYRKTVN